MNMSHSSRQPSRHTIFVLSPAFRAFDTHDLCRGSSVPNRERNLTCISRLRHARSPQRVIRAKSRTQSHLHFAPLTRTISAEGHPCQIANTISPAFRAFDTHNLRRGSSVPNRERNLTCISRLRHARSPQRVIRAKSRTQSHLHFASSTRTISTKG